MKTMPSLKFCGRSTLKVSGKQSANTPAITEGTPRLSIGSGPHNWASLGMYGVVRLAMRATIEQQPMAWALIEVGKASAVIV